MRHNRHYPTGPPEHRSARFGHAHPHAHSRSEIVHELVREPIRDMTGPTHLLPPVRSTLLTITCAPG